MLISVKVTTNAKKNEVRQVKFGTYAVRLKAKPINDQANELLVEILAEYFKVSRKEIKIVSGRRTTHKRVAVGVNLENGTPR
jgi:uncharacterized protein